MKIKEFFKEFLFTLMVIGSIFGFLSLIQQQKKTTLGCLKEIKTLDAPVLSNGKVSYDEVTVYGIIEGKNCEDPIMFRTK